jgi:hypothetical protein
VRFWRAAALSSAVLIAAGCDSSVTVSPAQPSGPAPVARAPGYSVPLSRIIAAANAAVNHTNPPFRLFPAGDKAPLPETIAERDVVVGCNEGRGTRVLGAAVATGPTTAGSRLYWAVFVDPPGPHIAPYAEGAPKNPIILNWIGGFVPVKDPRNIFCDFGRAANLPPLPVFKS